MADYLQREEDTSRLTLEEGGGSLLLEESTATLELGDGECGVEQEANTDLIVLETGSGLLLVEACPDTPDTPTHPAGGRAIPLGFQDLQLEDEDAIMLTLALLA